MEGDPAQFEAIGSRLGFHVDSKTPELLRLSWQGPRFPAFLCLGLALALLFISIPILQAIHVRGFTGPAGSLWYFPLMNVILFGISLYLIFQTRRVEIDAVGKVVRLRRRSLFRLFRLTVPYSEIDKLLLAIDQVESGFAVAGSTAAQSFSVPCLRLVSGDGASILIDRNSKRRLEVLAGQIGEKLGKSIEYGAGYNN
jgi:hypothetical protein